jgi:hypothetical protein
MKGNKPNNYDSPMLSQQPVLVLSDNESEEATLIKAIIDDVEDAALIKAIEALEKQFGEGGGPGVANMKPIHRQMGRSRTHFIPDRSAHGDVTVTSPSGHKRIIPTEDFEGAIKTRKDDGATEIGKARRPIPDDRGPKDAPWDDRGRPKHPGAPERPHPEPEYPGPREKRDPMPGERKKDWTLGKAAGDPKVHISSDEAQRQIEDYLSSHGPKQSKMGHGVDTESGEQLLYSDPKVSSKSGRRIQKNSKKAR